MNKHKRSLIFIIPVTIVALSFFVSKALIATTYDLENPERSEMLVGTDLVVNNQDNSSIICSNSNTNCLVVWEDYRSNSDADIYGQFLAFDKSVFLLGQPSKQDSQDYDYNFAIYDGQYDQQNPSIAFDRTNYLVVWQDDRNGNYDIYGQLISTAGDKVGSEFFIASGSQSEINPAVSFDGTNYLVVYQKDFGVYARFVTTSGTLWGSEFYISCNSPLEENPALTFDGTNYLVVWQDDRNGNYDIYGQLVTTSGDLSGSAFSVSSDSKDEINPALTFDGATNYLVVWQKGFPDDWGIYAQFVTTSGTLSGAQFYISYKLHQEQNPSIAFDGTNYLVVWEDNRNGTYEIYGKFVDTSGNLLSEISLPDLVATGDQTMPHIAYDSTNSHFIATWTDGRGLYGDNDGTDIYGQRILTSGSLPDVNIPISNNLSKYIKGEYTRVAFGGSKYLVFWDSDNDGDGIKEFYGQFVNESGETIDNNFLIDDKGGDYKDITGGEGNFLAVYGSAPDGENPAGQIVGRLITEDTVGGKITIRSENTIRDCGYFPSAIQPIDAIYDGNNYLVIWADTRGQVYGRFMDESGNTIGDEFRISPDNSLEPCSASTSTAFDSNNNRYLVTWKEDAEIYSRYVYPDQGVKPNEGKELIIIDADVPSVAFDNSYSRYLTVYTREVIIDSSTFSEIYIQLFDADRNPIGQEKQICERHCYFPTVAFDGENFVISYEITYDGLDTDSDSYALLVDATGEILGIPYNVPNDPEEDFTIYETFVVSNSRGNNCFPQVASNGLGQSMFVWPSAQHGTCRAYRQNCKVRQEVFGGFFDYTDTDKDGIFDDGDGSSVRGDNPCTGGNTVNCDDNCWYTPNPDQFDADADGIGDVCDDNCTIPKATIVGSISGAGAPNYLDGAQTVFVLNGYAYITSRNDNALSIFDVSVPGNPVFVGSVQDNINLEIATGVWVSGQYAYVVCGGSSGRFTVVDVSNRSKPTIKVSLEGYGGRNIFVDGGYAYVVNWHKDTVFFIDISAPENPIPVGSFSGAGTPYSLDHPYDVAKQGNYLYVASEYNDALIIIDASDPINPEPKGKIDGTGPPNYLDGPVGVVVRGNHAYIGTVYDYSLVIVNISDPTNPTLTGVLAEGIGGAEGLFSVIGDYAYIPAWFDKGLYIVDVSDPTNPTFADSLTTPANICDGQVHVVGNYAYCVSSTNASLDVIDVSGFVDTDCDGIPDDGDGSTVIGDSPCTGGETHNCDDNCIGTNNPSQKDINGNGIGDACEAGIPPIADFSGIPTGGEEPLTVNFKDYSTDGIVSWSWDFGDGGSSNEQNPTYQYPQDGVYTVTLTVTEADGDTDTETKTNYITGDDTSPTADFTGSPTNGTAPLTVNFTDNSTGYDQPLSYEWDFDNNGTIDSTAQNPSYTYTNPETYTVKLTVTDSDGSPDILTRTNYITVFIPIEVSISTDQSLYQEGEPVQITVEAYNPNPVDITLEFSSSCQATYIIDGTYNYLDDKVCAAVITYVTLEPYGSHTWEFTHSSGDYYLSPGIHIIVGEVLGYGQSDPLSFEVCSNPPVRIGGTYYYTLQETYNAAVDGDILQSQAVVITEDLNICRNISVTLEGGYNCDYTAIIGETTLKGTMTICDGIVTIGNFVLEK